MEWINRKIDNKIASRFEAARPGRGLQRRNTTAAPEPKPLQRRKTVAPASDRSQDVRYAPCEAQRPHREAPQAPHVKARRATETNRGRQEDLVALPPPPPIIQQAEAEPQLAGYFDEGQGYFLVKALGSGADGSAALVRSRWNGKLYVRKEDQHFSDLPQDPATTPRETANALRVADVKGCYRSKGWTRWSHPVRPVGIDVTYWHYYDLGCLDSLVRRMERDRKPVPALWYTGWLVDMIHIMVNVHAKGVVHCDAHQGNWLMRFQPNSAPSIHLGDLGRSKTRTEIADQAKWVRYCWNDFYLPFQAICEMLGVIYAEQEGWVANRTGGRQIDERLIEQLDKIAMILQKDWLSSKALHDAILEVSEELEFAMAHYLNNQGQDLPVPAITPPNFPINEGVRAEIQKGHFKQWRVATMGDDKKSAKTRLSTACHALMKNDGYFRRMDGKPDFKIDGQ